MEWEGGWEGKGEERSGREGEEGGKEKDAAGERVRGGDGRGGGDN